MGFSGSDSTKVDPLLWFDSAFRIEKLNSSFDAKNGQNYQLDDLAQLDDTTSQEDLSIPLTNAVLDSNNTSKFADSLQINFNSVTALPLFNPMMDSSNVVKVLDSIKTVIPTTAKGKKPAVVADTLALRAEIARLDSIRLDSLQRDSTARIEQFKFKRKDSPTISLYDQKATKLFVQPSSGVRRRVVEIDSTGKNVEIREKIGDVTTKVILTIPLEEYVELRLKTRQEEMWDAIAYQYELKDSKRGLGELIKDITDFEIPLPSVGILSIFGPPKINLRIGGAVDIHGAWRNETTEGVTASRLGNTRNEPDFKQTVQINVNGTIGDKLTISADWNTERTFEYENQLKIKYTGYEDEIVQSVEAGNVSLQTSPLVGGSEALFGIKATFKMGPLTLTTLASQKKGEIKEKTVTGGTTTRDFEIHAYEYSSNHYFIDAPYADTINTDLNLFNKYYANPNHPINNQYIVRKIEVWKSYSQSVPNSTERRATALIDLEAHKKDEPYPDTARIAKPDPGRVEQGRFILLTEGVDYIFNENIGQLSFISQINKKDIIAIAYQREGVSTGEADDVYFGEYFDQVVDTSKSLVLKLVKPADLLPKYTEAWNLLLKNIYSVGGRNIKKEGFVFDIKYKVEGQEPQSVLGDVRFINAFGLDQVGPDGQGQSDGLFDFVSGVTIFPATGEIMFPVLQPFGLNIPKVIPNADSLRYMSVYNEEETFARQNNIKDKFIMTGSFSGETRNDFDLGFTLVENSVKVNLNGRDLSAGIDYYMDYSTGKLTIRNDAALVPGANLKITYEENDLFQLASKTLFGIRGQIDFSKRTKLGFSALTLTQQTLSDKVRIGEEPLSNSIYGIDFSTSADLPFLTKAIDKIFPTREMSSISLSGEFAYMNPDPNTKKSTISSDEGKSIAYIDDFEGSKRIIPVGVSYTSWKDLSIPNELKALSGLSTSTDSATMSYKGKSFWYNVLPSDVMVKYIWPEKKVARGDEQVTVLDYVYIPDVPGTYNYSTTMESVNKPQTWGGIMKQLSSTASNLVVENIEFIEFWMNVDVKSENTKIYIDLGKISEDVIPNGVLDTEDKIRENELIDDGEDTGLDGMFDVSEQAASGSTDGDPSHDNFSYTNSGTTLKSNYVNINGTQGNAALTDIGRFPDTEDLNHNRFLDQLNSYYRYEIPLSTDPTKNKYIAGGGANNWYLFRIPLKDTTLLVYGNPSFSVVEYLRLFVTNATDTVHFRMADFNLVGNQWQKKDLKDSILAISVVNIEDNYPAYQSPPGVQRERDRSRPDEEIFRNEQSLNLTLTDLPMGQSREAIKYLFRPLDVFNYKQMKLFIHGEEDQSTNTNSVSYVGANGQNADVYFRFGADTNNFYAYKQPITPGWNEVSILFSELTALKDARDTTQITSEFIQKVAGQDNQFYVVKGNPSLIAIKFLSVVIVNRATGAISGQVWVNELRVIGADDTPGWAYSFGTSLKLADLMNINFNMSQTDPYFHRLNDRFGSRVDTKSWSMSTDVNVLKFLPFDMPGSNLRVTYSRTEALGKPLYFPGTDIRVEESIKKSKYKTAEEIRSESQTFSTSDSWNISNIKLNIPSNYWLIRDTWNAISFNFNYNKSFSRNPTTLAAKSWIWNASANYSLQIGNDYFFYPTSIPVLGTALALMSDYRNAKFYYTPQSIAWNVSARRNRNINVTRPQRNSDSKTIVSRDFTSSRGFNYTWKLTDNGFWNIGTTYNVDVASTLSYLETDAYNNQRTEREIWKDIFGGVMFGKDYSYKQVFDLKTSPRLPSFWDLKNFFTLTAGYGVTYQWDNDFRQEELGRRVGYSNRINLGFSLKLKALAAPLFKEDESKNQQKTAAVAPTRSRNFDEENQDAPKTDPNLTAPALTKTDSTVAVDSLAGRPTAITKAVYFLKTLARTLFFDYENISVNFSNDNTASSNGIKGKGSGIKNFWGYKYSASEGASRLYMLGLKSDVGPRAANGNLTDNYSQRNSIDLKTSRPLWEGARIDLNWKTGWSINKATSLRSDSNGVTSIQNITSSGTLDRTFFSLPPVFFLSMFKSGIKRVSELYDPKSANKIENLSQAFMQGFETLPLVSKIGFLKTLMKYVPRPNWRITWDGLEKFAIFKSFAKRVSLDHAYGANYTEGWRINPDGTQATSSQKISYGFSPLVGLNLTLNSFWDGNFSGNVKYSTRTNYDLAPTTQKITEGFSREIGVTLNYSKSGFEVPLFGIALKNDIEFSFSYSNSKNSTVVFDMNQFTEEGTPQDGTIRTSLEPRIKYVISSRVTLSVFYKRSSISPEGAARVTASTINEAGLDVRISITQ
jgi:cell surface protein SprA